MTTANRMWRVMRLSSSCLPRESSPGLRLWEVRGLALNGKRRAAQARALGLIFSPGRDKLRRATSQLIVPPIAFFCEYWGHDAKRGDFALHADDSEFLFSENLEDVLHRYLSSFA